jgi:hypothetical protein
MKREIWFKNGLLPTVPTDFLRMELTFYFI